MSTYSARFRHLVLEINDDTELSDVDKDILLTAIETRSQDDVNDFLSEVIAEGEQTSPGFGAEVQRLQEKRALLDECYLDEAAMVARFCELTHSKNDAVALEALQTILGNGWVS